MIIVKEYSLSDIMINYFLLSFLFIDEICVGINRLLTITKKKKEACELLTSKVADLLSRENTMHNVLRALNSNSISF